MKTNNKYDLSLFSKDRIDWLENEIFEENGKFFIICLIRNKKIQIKPEEIIRQLMLDKLIN